MKKTYITPETEVIVLKTTEALLVGSPDFGGGGPGGSADAREMPFFEDDFTNM